MVAAAKLWVKSASHSSLPANLRSRGGGGSSSVATGEALCLRSGGGPRGTTTRARVVGGPSSSPRLPLEAQHCAAPPARSGATDLLVLELREDATPTGELRADAASASVVASVAAWCVGETTME